MKKQKYSNGSLVARKDFKGVGSITGSAQGNQNYTSGSVTARTKIGGATVSADMFKDSKGTTGSSFSMNKQLPNNKSVNAYNNKGGSGASVSKTFKRTGITVRAGVNKNASGQFNGSMSIQKPL